MIKSSVSSDIVTLARLPSSSSLKVNNRSFRHASPCLWNHLPKELCRPADHEDLSLSPDLTHTHSIYVCREVTSDSLQNQSRLVHQHRWLTRVTTTTTTTTTRPITSSTNVKQLRMTGRYQSHCVLKHLIKSCSSDLENADSLTLRGLVRSVL